jgi:hypothetical protein
VLAASALVQDAVPERPGVRGKRINDDTDGAVHETFAGDAHA